MKNKITNKSSEEQIQEYWQDVMEHRMPLHCEIEILKSIGLGFYARHKNFENLEGYIEHNNFLDFIKTNKRPFGNKNKQQSVIFNLGWDYQRVLCNATPVEPEWVTNEANTVYEALIEKINEEMKDDVLEKDIIWKL